MEHRMNRWAVVLGTCALGATSAVGCGGDETLAFSGSTSTTTTSTSGTGTTGTGGTSTGAQGGGGDTGGTTNPTGGGGTGGATTGGGGAGGMTTTSSGGGGTGGVPVTCGDGVKDPGEACDGADLGGKSCVDYGYSNPAGLICGVDCSLKAGGCHATCDGSKLESGETCDGSHLGNNSCQDFGFANPAGLTCVGCQPDPSGCMAACGNNVLEVGEVCDGANLGGKTCQDYGYSAAAGLACAAGCASYSTAGCAATCNGVLEPGEKCDGANLGGKTCQDYGYANAAGLSCQACDWSTSGCVAVCGNNLVEPGEQCDDGNAANGDGCGGACQFEAGGTTCASAIPVNMATWGTKTFNHTTVGGGQHTSSKCTSAGPDRVFKVTSGVGGFLTANLVRSQTSYNSELYASATCADGNANSDLVCADSKDPMNQVVLKGGEVVSFRVAAGQVSYLFVDGYTNAEAGTFQLVVNLSHGDTCADPIPITIEPGTGMTLLGNTMGLMSATDSSCGGQGYSNALYKVTRSATGPLTFFADPALTNYNSLIYAQSVCADPFFQLGCSNVAGGSGEVLSLASVQGNVPIFFGVDGSQAGGTLSVGDYGVVMTP